MKASIFTLALLLIAGIALAAGIDGKWEGEVSGNDGVKMLSYDFKTDGKKLTGTTVDPQGAKVEIKNGEIEGNNISFDVPVEMNGVKFMIAYTGVLSGDELKLSFGMKMPDLSDGDSFSFIAQKGDGENRDPQGESFSYSSSVDGALAPKIEFTAKRVK